MKVSLTLVLSLNAFHGRPLCPVTQLHSSLEISSLLILSFVISGTCTRFDGPLDDPISDWGPCLTSFAAQLAAASLGRGELFDAVELVLTPTPPAAAAVAVDDVALVDCLLAAARTVAEPCVAWSVPLVSSMRMTEPLATKGDTDSKGQREKG